MSRERMKELVKEFNENYQGQTVKQIVELLTNHKVYEFDSTDSKCKELKKKLLKAANGVIADIQTKGGQEFDPEPESNLRTEISAWFQREIKDKIENHTDLNIKSLGWSGYPRFEIQDGYLMIKTMRSTTDSSVRTLYLSPRGLKISKSGYHLGLIFTYDLESNEDIPFAYPKEVKLVDLSKIVLSTKIEFSASSNRLREAEI